MQLFCSIFFFLLGLTMLILLMSGLLLTAVIHDGCGQPQSLASSGPLPLDAFQPTDDSSNDLTNSQTQGNFLRWIRRPLHDLSSIEKQLNANNDEGLPPSPDETFQKKWSGILNPPRVSCYFLFLRNAPKKVSEYKITMRDYSFHLLHKF